MRSAADKGKFRLIFVYASFVYAVDIAGMTEATSDVRGHDIVVADSVTKLGPAHRGRVLVAASHGGVFAAYLAAKAGVRAVVLNDAGRAKDDSGLAGLAYLEALGIPAATVSHLSARIGDGKDTLDCGLISAANAPARAAGVIVGEPCAVAAARLVAAPNVSGRPPAYAEARYVLLDAPGAPAVWGLDSASLIEPVDRERIVIIGSHGGLVGGRPEAALKYDARAAVFHDAGGGKDGAGYARLPALDARGIAAATVEGMSARIGDARSLWETGVLSQVNGCAARLGARPGLTTQRFAGLLIDRFAQHP